MEKKGFKLILLIFIVISLNINSTLASTFIIGYVNDSFDGEIADGHNIMIWNPANGINDNLTDIIGPSGNSQASNFYMLDCELLNVPCNIGDILSLKVLGLENGYISRTINVSITGAGFELAENLMINSKPNVSAVMPLNYANISGQISFNCSAFDYDGNLESISLYTNFTGIWELNETRYISGSSNSTIFIKNPSDGRYVWGCLVNDSFGIINYSINKTVTSDSHSPIINSISTNETKVCGIANNIRVSCNTSDALSGIYNVIIQASSNVSSNNYSAVYAGGGIYYSDILLDKYGSWNFSCISNDSANNNNNSIYTYNGVFQNLANLEVNSSSIIFSKNNPIENEEIIINVSVKNDGCINANISVGFYEGDPLLGGVQIGSNKTGNVVRDSSFIFNMSYISKIGLTNIFVVADINNSFSEFNESDNKANKSMAVVSWHTFYGNITADRILANSGLYNLSLWLNDSNSSGNVYISDTESQINWASLIPIGRNKTNSLTNNDFSELDSLLGSNSYRDSIIEVYTNGGNTPKNTSSFLVSNRIINNVPIINTTLDYNFFTGILWDSFDDSNGEYDSSDREDVVFVSNINRNSIGSYGKYDYEIRVPSKLREYDPTDSNEIYIYFDLN